MKRLQRYLSASKYKPLLDIDWWFVIFSAANFTADKDGLQACNCKDACIETAYSAKVYTYNFPSINYAKTLGLSDSKWLY